MVEADDVLFALAAFALDANQLLGIDVVAVLRRVAARVAGAGERGHNAGAVVVHAAEQNAAALVRISLLAVLAEGVVVRLAKAKHGNSEGRSTTEIADFRFQIADRNEFLQGIEFNLKSSNLKSLLLLHSYFLLLHSL